MRYPKDHKDQARRHLVDKGGRHAKQHGFDASGMAALAASAGVTTGALYKHFDGKSDFFCALVTAELSRAAALYAGLDEGSVAQTLRGYLSLAHVRRPDAGCPLTSLAPDIARADDAVRAAFEAGLREVHAQMARLTGSPEAAWALMAQNVGAVMLARALPSVDLQKAVLAAARQSADRLLAEAGEACKSRTPQARRRASRPVAAT